jgi:hypothetical protein
VEEEEKGRVEPDSRGVRSTFVAAQRKAKAKGGQERPSRSRDECRVAEKKNSSAFLAI